MRKNNPQLTFVDPAGSNDIAWVKKHLIDKSPKSKSQIRRFIPPGSTRS